MTKLKTLIFDCEIIGIIISNPDEYDEIMARGCGGMRYANGWTDYKGMGIACICAWDCEGNMPRVFTNAGSLDNLQDFQKYLNEFELFVGFNTIRFDNKLLEENGLHFRPDAYHYDILRELWKADGLNPDRFNPKTHGGYGLDDCCRVNFGIGKTDGGAVSKDTPRMWQRGEYGKVVDNCMRDVMLTRRLLGRIALDSESKARSFINPKRGGTVSLPHPYQQDGFLFVSKQ